MAKKICCVCGKEMGIMTGKVKLADGYICTKCYEKAGFSSWNGTEIVNNGSLTVEQFLNKSVAKNDALTEIERFTPTSSPAPFALFDDNSRTMILSAKPHASYKPKHFTMFSYEQLVDFELLEDGAGIASGGLGRAAVGGLLFGGVGAVVGGVTRSQKPTCSQLTIKLTMKNYAEPAFYIDLISAETKKSSFVYKTFMKNAQDVLSQLQLITNSMQAENNSKAVITSNSISTADEIRKFKELLDDGIITQDEFDAKKKELLGL